MAASAERTKVRSNKTEFGTLAHGDDVVNGARGLAALATDPLFGEDDGAHRLPLAIITTLASGGAVIRRAKRRATGAPLPGGDDA